ncbi:hypothetical protein Tco_0802572 [Tanacetum coccineum]|uniref:Integrase, catalytic region, zinc finger, CCHC-type, peptidase aspartic, catalytic n=1 Tax=Tanacetum coccineum TaxID=301880 RepID=A0ABQ4ZZ65_9ASTR
MGSTLNTLEWIDRRVMGCIKIDMGMSAISLKYRICNCQAMVKKTKVNVQVMVHGLRGKENGLQILQSIDQGPFELRTTRDALGTTPKGDVRATNIVLQGLPKDIYKLINHNIEAKAIWDNVKMLLAGSELTKEDRESQLYDEFERFKMLPGENINEYYVRFHKLVNDMRNIRMTMPNIQLNSKFVNNMSPEWDRFVTAVKLNQATIQDGWVVVQNVQGRQNQNQRYFTRGNGTAGNGGAQNRAGNANAGTDKAKIIRKRLKPGKHEHGNGRARKKPGGSYQSNYGQTSVKKSTLGQSH